MDAIQIDPKSWHYRLAHTYGPDRVDYEICGYTRAVLRGACFAVLVTIIITLFAVPVADALAWVAASLVTGHWVGAPLLMPAIGGEGVALVVFVTFWIMVMLREWLYERRRAKRLELIQQLGSKWLEEQEERERQPGMLTLMYRSFKDKFCVPVEVVR